MNLLDVKDKSSDNFGTILARIHRSPEKDILGVSPMTKYNALQTAAIVVSFPTRCFWLNHASQIVYTQVDKCLASGRRLPGSKVGALTAVDGGS
jgi:hypothetical protein